MKKIVIIILFLELILNVESLGQTYKQIGEYKFDAKNENPKATVYKDTVTGLLFFKADFDLDLDGHPKAYHPQNKGLIHIANARNGQGELSRDVILHVNNIPYLQNAADPAPGYYVSLTTLHLSHYGSTDTRRYVHPDSFTYFVVPGGKFTKHGVNVGDIALVYNQKTKKHAYAIYADSGPRNMIGEGSTLLAKKLGITVQIRPTSGRIVGGLDTADVLYIVFPGTGKGPNGYPTLKDADVTALGKKAIARFSTEQELIQKLQAFYTPK